MNKTPLVSVLITTFNRSGVLRRSMHSVLSQSFKDLELIVIDDCSKDDTAEVVKSFQDDRIRYIYNETNVGSIHGDRAHIRRFIYELMQGTYFVYLCDDDYWLSDTLLERQIKAFENYDNLSMVIGGQVSNFIDTTVDADTEIIKRDDIPPFSYHDLRRAPIPKKLLFFSELYAQYFMTSKEFLHVFSSDPINRNIVVGATLYSKKHFIAAGAMANKKGSKWQAGYELLLGPGCEGNVVYFDEPAVVVEVRATNASFGGTQVDHYLDCMVSVNHAFKAPLKKATAAKKRKIFKRAKKEAIRNISRSFLSNTLTIKIHNKLTACGEKNIDKAVQPRHALFYYIFNRILPKKLDLKFFTILLLPKRAIRYLTKGVVF